MENSSYIEDRGEGHFIAKFRQNAKKFDFVSSTLSGKAPLHPPDTAKNKTAKKSLEIQRSSDFLPESSGYTKRQLQNLSQSLLFIFCTVCSFWRCGKTESSTIPLKSLESVIGLNLPKLERSFLKPCDQPI